MSYAEHMEMLEEEFQQVSDERTAAIYDGLTRAEHLQVAVAALSPQELRGLNGWLAREGCMSGIPSLIHGMILEEAAQRFMKMKHQCQGGVG